MIPRGFWLNLDAAAVRDPAGRPDVPHGDPDSGVAAPRYRGSERDDEPGARSADVLRAAAVQAARSSKFSPTKLSGQPVKVTGVIVYNFVP